jgi:hypothetical protein
MLDREWSLARGRLLNLAGQFGVMLRRPEQSRREV